MPDYLPRPSPEYVREIAQEWSPWLLRLEMRQGRIKLTEDGFRRLKRQAFHARAFLDPTLGPEARDRHLWEFTKLDTELHLADLAAIEGDTNATAGEKDERRRICEALAPHFAGVDPHLLRRALWSKPPRKGSVRRFVEEALHREPESSESLLVAAALLRGNPTWRKWDLESLERAVRRARSDWLRGRVAL